MNDDDLRGLMAQGKSLLRASEPARAREVFRKAFLLAEQRYGTDALDSLPSLLWVIHTFSPLREEAPGEWAEALALCERALRLAGSAPGADVRYVIEVLALQAVFEHAMGHPDKALAHVRQAVQAWIQSSAQIKHVSDTHLGLCEFLLDLGQPREALDFVERLRRALEQKPPGRTDRLLRVADFFIGRSLMALGRYNEARAVVTARLEALAKESKDSENPFFLRLQGLLADIATHENE
ncbi:tetratricopeptide repeat protein [Polyangium sp. y55x31]|uniref:tetratricopeptide repeat protein n=1 Tax=Polyangium sp. y55x31 TaxID=3042688 RepID=UPI0024826FC2|nr:tetratricopeptide repeat protein [Polyangium sp. y55x31]MDI1480517.1 tetratricopeptide repeat protein [Polyangium sp. y55x31]